MIKHVFNSPVVLTHLFSIHSKILNQSFSCSKSPETLTGDKHYILKRRYFSAGIIQKYYRNNRESNLTLGAKLFKTSINLLNIWALIFIVIVHHDWLDNKYSVSLLICFKFCSTLKLMYRIMHEINYEYILYILMIKCYIISVKNSIIIFPS